MFISEVKLDILTWESMLTDLQLQQHIVFVMITMNSCNHCQFYSMRLLAVKAAIT